MKPLSERYKRVRRLRKKFKTDEFVELGFEVNFSLATPLKGDEVDVFIDGIFEFLDESKYHCCSVISSLEHEHEACYMICSNKRYGKLVESDIELTKAFFETYSDNIIDLKFSPLKDMNSWEEDDAQE